MAEINPATGQLEKSKSDRPPSPLGGGGPSPHEFEPLNPSPPTLDKFGHELEDLPSPGGSEAPSQEGPTSDGSPSMRGAQESGDGRPSFGGDGMAEGIGGSGPEATANDAVNNLENQAMGGALAEQ